MVEPITCQELYSMLLEGLPSPFEARQLFGHLTGLELSCLPREGARAVAPDVAAEAQVLLSRRQEGEPLQYLLGEWEFYGLPFRLGPGVLIPRPETELLVDLALEELAGCEALSPQVVDLCSGTGCVAVAIGKNAPKAAVTAVELSPLAFSYLEQNINWNQVQVQPTREDLNRYIHPRPIHLLTANPPYIPAGELKGLQKEVRREPAMALDGGPDGLDIYRALIPRFFPQMAPGGVLLLEVGAGQGDAVERLLLEQGYGDTKTYRDLAGIPRVVRGQRPIKPTGKESL